jgi:hypothetical protein
MRVAPRRRKPLSLAWRLLLGLPLVYMTPLSLFAQEAQTKGLPPRVARVLRWLPLDTETLFVARSVSLPDFNPDGRQEVNWQDIGVSLAAGDLALVDGGKHSKALRGRKIECIVSGARNFEGVSKFGSLRSEGCTIIVFETDLGDAAREWTERLRKQAKAVRTLVGREVFVFPSTTVMDRWTKQTEWQGTYFVLLTPNTVLCASGDRYLESVLRRANEVPELRALPENLPEWKQVDLEAPAWMLRHIPKPGEKARIVGATGTFMKDGFRIVYIPRTGSDVDMKQIEKEWLPESLFQTEILRDQLQTVRQPDGTVVLSCAAKPGEGTIWFGWQLYRLQAVELFLAEE